MIDARLMLQGSGIKYRMCLRYNILLFNNAGGVLLPSDPGVKDVRFSMSHSRTVFRIPIMPYWLVGFFAPCVKIWCSSSVTSSCPNHTFDRVSCLLLSPSPPI